MIIVPRWRGPDLQLKRKTLMGVDKTDRNRTAFDTMLKGLQEDERSVASKVK